MFTMAFGVDVPGFQVGIWLRYCSGNVLMVALFVGGFRKILTGRIAVLIRGSI